LIINICSFILYSSHPGREHYNSIKDVIQYYEFRHPGFYQYNTLMHYHYRCLEQGMDQKPVHQNENIIDDKSDKILKY